MIKKSIIILLVLVINVILGCMFFPEDSTLSVVATPPDGTDVTDNQSITFEIEYFIGEYESDKTHIMDVWIRMLESIGTYEVLGSRILVKQEGSQTIEFSIEDACDQYPYYSSLSDFKYPYQVFVNIRIDEDQINLAQSETIIYY